MFNTDALLSDIVRRVLRGDTVPVKTQFLSLVSAKIINSGYTPITKKIKGDKSKVLISRGKN